MSRIVHRDAFDALSDMDAESVHAVVTDPPYGLAFMGRSWDDFEPGEYQNWCEEWAKLALNVLKPGGHLLSFSGNRTHHRLFSGVEDAGFEVRDTLTWHYGSGFPKALDVSKALDKEKYKHEHDIQAFGNYLKDRRKERGFSKAEVDRRLGTNTAYSWWEGRKDGIQLPGWDHYEQLKDILDLDDRFDELMEKEAADRVVVGRRTDGVGNTERSIHKREGLAASRDGTFEVTAPTTNAAREWDGWKTSLKPATEFIILARKPLSEGTVAENVLAHGTAALNIDECRIATDDRLEGGANGPNPTMRPLPGDERDDAGKGMFSNPKTVEVADDRYPANALFDEGAAADLDREVGELGGGDRNVLGEPEVTDAAEGYTRPNKSSFTHKPKGHLKSRGDTGGPSRYFYTSKASRSERTLDGKIDNGHPTVKPVDLMEWLVRLVTAEGQTVLDPFAGTGTTCLAAKNLGREFIGVEKQAKWADVARARCGLDVDDPSWLTPDEQATLADGGVMGSSSVPGGGD